jgi:hypothetical protein
VIIMLRTALIVLVVVATVLAVPARAFESAMAVIDSIYALALEDRGPAWKIFEDRAEYLSRSLIDLWTRANAAQPEDDELGPVDADIVTDTNGMLLGAYRAIVEHADARSSTIAVTLVYADAAPDQQNGFVRYDFIAEDGAWKIDDIRSARWDLRRMLETYIAENGGN